MTTSLPTYKKAVTEDKLNASLQLQMAELPDSGLEMSASEMCEKIRAYLWTAELARVNGMKGGLPLYPMEWEDGECNGVPMKLLRVNNRMKTKDEVEFVNPNYGRFFFARHVQQIGEDGNPAYNDKGYAILDMVDFQWFDQSNYARSGAFAAVGNADLSNLLQATFGVDLDPQNMWPVNLIKAL